MNFLIKISLKFYCHLVLFTYGPLSWEERFINFLKTVLVFGPIAFALGALNTWYLDNRYFFFGVIALVFLNMVFGAVMHWKKNQFSIKEFLDKTAEMIISLSLIYFGLELIISRGGDNYITHGFRAVLQITSYLYPFSKIAKNVHILSKGKYPPEWIMLKLYDFEKTGDLGKFLDTKKNKDE